MPAKTPDRVEQHQLGANRLLKGIFTTENIDDEDTWTPGITGIVNVAWKATNGTDLVALTHSGGVITAASTGDNHNGEIWVECVGY